MCAKPIQSTVESLKWIYGVVVALSISEAFMQFALDMESTAPGIQWDRLPSLCCFLLLVVPFYHGMSRYFCEMYDGEPTGKYYAGWLLADCLVFTIEAGLFFVLARSLPRSLGLQFYVGVVALLFLDVLWGTLVWKYRTETINSWVVVNLCTIPFIAPICLTFRMGPSWWAISWGTFVVLVRTVADYWTSWEFYFPSGQVDDEQLSIET